MLKQTVVLAEEKTGAWIHTLCWPPDSQTLYGGVFSRRSALIIWKNNQMSQFTRIFLEFSQMTIKNWRNAAETVLNGKRLGIKEGELSRTLSIDSLTGHFAIFSNVTCEW